MPWADPIRPASEDADHLALVGRPRLALVFVRAVHVRTCATRTRRRTCRRACRPDEFRRRDARRAPAPRASPAMPPRSGGRRSRGACSGATSEDPRQHGRLADERERSLVAMSAMCCRNHGSIRVSSCARSSVSPSLNPAATWNTRSGVVTAIARSSVGRSSVIGRFEARAAGLSSERIAFAERLAERAADRHRLADRLHLRAEHGLRRRELLEREPRPLDDDVIDRRLERCRRDARDVVVELVERVADRELRGDLRDRKARRLRRERRAARQRAGSSRSRAAARSSDRPRTGRSTRRWSRRSRASRRSPHRACADIPCRSASSRVPP